MEILLIAAFEFKSMRQSRAHAPRNYRVVCYFDDKQTVSCALAKHANEPCLFLLKNNAQMILDRLFSFGMETIRSNY